MLLTHQDMHLIHHLFPSIPWHRYHQVWRLGKNLLEPHVSHRNIVQRERQTPPTIVANQQLLNLTVNEVTDIAQGVRCFELIAGDNSILPPFSAGAHIDVHIEPGLIRQYSLCNSEHESHRYLIAVKREQNGRGGSSRLHQLFATGSPATVSLPRNNFPLDLAQSDYLLIAGGIGLTPILAMAHALELANKAFTVHIFVRSEDFLPFGVTLSQLPFSRRIKIYYDSEKPLLERNITQIIGKPNINRSLYICGPGAFMSHIINAATDQRWPKSAINFESFSAEPAAKANNHPFELTLSRSNITLTVAADESIVDAVQRANITIPISCGQGMCGTCVCEVLEGEIEHRDSIFSDAEHANGRQLTACVSRAKGAQLILKL